MTFATATAATCSRLQISRRATAQKRKKKKKTNYI